MIALASRVNILWCDYRKQQPNESVSSYSKDMFNIMDRLQMKEDAAHISQRLQCLKQESCYKMLLMKPTSLRDAELNVLLLEKSIESAPETQLLSKYRKTTKMVNSVPQFQML